MKLLVCVMWAEALSPLMMIFVETDALMSICTVVGQGLRRRRGNQRQIYDGVLHASARTLRRGCRESKQAIQACPCYCLIALRRKAPSLPKMTRWATMATPTSSSSSARN